MKLYLLRHAERGHGKEQDTLTLKGIKQSRKIVPYLETLHIDKIICANTKRAIKTIEPFLKNLSVEVTSLVNEQEMGSLRGKSGTEYRNAIEKSGLDKKNFRPEGGENYYDLIERAKKFLYSLKKEKAENILISTHAGFIRAVIKLLLNLPEEKLKFDFGSVTFIELDREFKVINYSLNQIVNP
ncbi:MAG: phosphoglycerate mutase family protein [Candidatus Nanoarchaeia archaeon]|nr:phosphoglycerate mutase family protein [Candidatus Nanoarchaeia archaeon]MDD5357679.1 phosphoglycerate mutase family protein [Candidatus Nanoarchaeia archaeon]MDD5588598.1 phosphoglycerate mutase family protein [Candidatus Nanoarchaeia archaeon]